MPRCKTDFDMLQDLRDYWLPLMLFLIALLVAAALLTLVISMPFALEYAALPPFLEIFANDGTTRRISIAAAIGLIVTAFVFFRPRSIKRTEPEA